MSKKKQKRGSRAVGQAFQSNVEASCKNEGVFFHNIKDVFIPSHLRGQVMLPKNKYDVILYSNGFLYPLELKTTSGKSFPFGSIQQHQIEGLYEDNKFQGVHAGVMINFRDMDGNPTYFIPIDKLVDYSNTVVKHYDDIQSGECPNPYSSRVNRASIPEAICKEIGIPVTSKKLRVNHRYEITKMLNDVVLHSRRRHKKRM